MPDYFDPTIDMQPRSVNTVQNIQPQRDYFDPTITSKPKRLVDQSVDVSEGVSPVEAFLTSMGRGFTTVARGLNLGPEFGITEPQESETVTNAMGQLEDRYPVSTTVGEVAGEVLPALAMTAGIPTPAALPARMLTTGGIGATEGAILQRGKGEDTSSGAITGGSVGAVSEIVAPYIGRIGTKIYNKVRGRAPSGALLDVAGRPTREFQSVLDEAGLTIDDLTEDALKYVKSAGGEVDPKQLARKTLLESQGISPTKAQITRDATDFQTQQELGKASGKVRSALDNQEGVITNRFSDAVKETGGKPQSSSVADAVIGKATELDREISDLYKLAREQSPGAKNVKFDELTATLRRLKESDVKAGGNISALIGELKSGGILTPDVKLQGRVSVETAEEVRKLANELYDAKNGYGNKLLREVKDAIDNDVFRASGEDIFKQARTSKAMFEKGLERPKVSKFDTRKQNLVRDILENKINPDEMINKVVVGKSWRPSDLKQLKDYVDGGPAWQDLRADVIETIKEKSFIGGMDANNNQALSRDRLQRVLESQIGWDKLGVIFEPREVAFLKNMLGVAKIREPVRGTALGKGPSAQAVKSLEEKLQKLPIFGDLVGFIGYDRSGRIMVKANPARVVSEAERQLPLSLTAGAIPIAQEYQKESQ